VPWTLRAEEGIGGCAHLGGAGTILVLGPGATFGALRVDGGAAVAAQNTAFPSLGAGTAQAGTSGATLVTDRAADIPTYLAGHWIEIANKGTWRIGTIANKTVTLVPNGNETISLAPGDEWNGVYRVDSLNVRNAKVLSGDKVLSTAAPSVDGNSSLNVNDGPPRFPSALRAQIVVSNTPSASFVTGRPARSSTRTRRFCSPRRTRARRRPSPRPRAATARSASR
jgi:hypothetical protein